MKRAPSGLYIFVLLAPITTPPAMIEVIKHLSSILCSTMKHIPTIVTTDEEMQIKVEIGPLENIKRSGDKSMFRMGKSSQQKAPPRRAKVRLILLLVYSGWA